MSNTTIVDLASGLTKLRLSAMNSEKTFVALGVAMEKIKKRRKRRIKGRLLRGKM